MTNKYKEYFDAHGSLTPELYTNLRDEVEKMQNVLSDHYTCIATVTRDYEHSPGKYGYGHIIDALKSYIKKDPIHAKKYGGVRAMAKEDTAIAVSILAKLKQHDNACSEKCKEVYSYFDENDYDKADELENKTGE
jgi:hypothetical protein